MPVHAYPYVIAIRISKYPRVGASFPSSIQAQMSVNMYNLCLVFSDVATLILCNSHVSGISRISANITIASAYYSDGH